MPSVICHHTLDQFWTSQRAIILVQCGQTVSSSALESTDLGNATCQNVWDQFWQSQRACVILVQRKQMVSSPALETTNMGNATCQQTSFGSLSGLVSYLCSAGRWSARLLCRQRIWAMRRASRFGTSFGSLSALVSYLCSAGRWSARLLWR